MTDMFYWDQYKINKCMEWHNYFNQQVLRVDAATSYSDESTDLLESHLL